MGPWSWSQSKLPGADRMREKCLGKASCQSPQQPQKGHRGARLLPHSKHLCPLGRTAGPKTEAAAPNSALRHGPEPGGREPGLVTATAPWTLHSFQGRILGVGSQWGKWDCAPEEKQTHKAGALDR